MIYVSSVSRNKLEPKSREYIFVGYSEHPGNFLFRDSTYPRKVVKARDVVFFEESFTNLKGQDTEHCKLEYSPLTLSDSTDVPVESKIDLSNQSRPAIIDDDEFKEFIDAESFYDNGETSKRSVVPSSLENNTPSERRYPLRDRKPTEHFTYSSYNYDEDEPKTFLEAINSSEKDLWMSAMKDEYKSLLERGTWELVDKPNKAIVPCKWVYKLKKDEYGNVIKYKARLVAKGYSQVPGVDYFETFSPVVRNSSLRTLLALSVQQDYKIRHLDVDTAFLNGDLEEEVFMYQPEGFIENGCREKVCKLRKSLYGLKQASRAWNIKLNKTLSEIGFIRTPSEPCVYTKSYGSEKVILAVYVDDIIILYKNEKSFDFVKSNLQNYFSLKDLGSVSYILGINVKRQTDCLKINQRTYIDKILKKFNMSDCKTVDTPLQNNNLEPADYGKVCDMPYQNLIGSLMFLAVNTRPDIAYATTYLSQFNTRYNESHWNAAKRILRYLKGSINFSITYKKDDNYIQGFADANWASCEIDRRSFTGFYFTMAGGPISWCSKKQRTVALSSTEAEYMSISAACQEAIFLRRFLSELIGKLDTVTIFSDSKTAINIAQNPVHHARTKHIDTRFHFIREKLEDKCISLKYLETNNMPADTLTKPLGRIAYNRYNHKMGIE